MTSSNEFNTFHRFTDFQSLAFSENSLWDSILNHLQTKVTPNNPHSCIFFQYNPKEVKVLTNLIFLVLA